MMRPQEVSLQLGPEYDKMRLMLVFQHVAVFPPTSHTPPQSS